MKLIVTLGLLFSIRVAVGAEAPKVCAFPCPLPEEKPLPLVEPAKPRTKILLRAVSARKDRVDRLMKLAKIAEDVINSDEFKTRVLSAYYNKKPGFASSGLTPAQIYQSLMEGRELLKKDLDYIWDMEIHMAKLKRGVLGQTNPSIKIIYFQGSGFESRNDCGLVGTIVHEQTHKLGHKHDYNRTARRPYSVPYSTGTIAAQLCAKLQKK